MAIDQALFESVQRGSPPAVRFYRWDPPCLSLGRNQQISANVDHLVAQNIDLVRRPTGGLAVLHDLELTYCVVVPVGWLGSPRATYDTINRGLLSGLARLGAETVQTRRNDVTPATFRNGGSCFAGTAPGEIVARGKKLIGSAQRCERRCILQHGSILVDGDQSRAARLLGRSDLADPHAITIRELLGYVPEWRALITAFREGLAAELGIALAPEPLSSAEQSRANELAAEFASTEWTQRV